MVELNFKIEEWAPGRIKVSGGGGSGNVTRLEKQVGQELMTAIAQVLKEGSERRGKVVTKNELTVNGVPFGGEG